MTARRDLMRELDKLLGAPWPPDPAEAWGEIIHGQATRSAIETACKPHLDLLQTGLLDYSRQVKTERQVGMATDYRYVVMPNRVLAEIIARPPGTNIPGSLLTAYRRWPYPRSNPLRTTPCPTEEQEDLTRLADYLLWVITEMLLLVVSQTGLAELRHRLHVNYAEPENGLIQPENLLLDKYPEGMLQLLSLPLRKTISDWT